MGFVCVCIICFIVTYLLTTAILTPTLKPCFRLVAIGLSCAAFAHFSNKYTHLFETVSHDKVVTSESRQRSYIRPTEDTVKLSHQSEKVTSEQKS